MDEEQSLPIEQKSIVEKLKNKSNIYSSHKSVSQNLLNTSIISLHIGILVNILNDDASDGFSGLDESLVILTSLSIFVQIIIFFAVTWLFYVKPDTKRGCITAKMINGYVTAASGISLIINIAISAINSKISLS